MAAEKWPRPRAEAVAKFLAETAKAFPAAELTPTTERVRGLDLTLTTSCVFGKFSVEVQLTQRGDWDKDGNLVYEDFWRVGGCLPSSSLEAAAYDGYGVLRLAVIEAQAKVQAYQNALHSKLAATIAGR